MGSANRDAVRFAAEELTHICQQLANTSTGLTGSEIGYVLKQIGVEDNDPTNTKWRRLFNALVDRQNRDQKGNIVLACIAKALAPARYVGNRALYEQKLESVNVILAFKGLRFQDDGKFHNIDKAASLTDAEARASRLKEDFVTRNLHPELLRFCKAELVADNYFHAVLEATKGIAETVRSITGLASDGAALIDDAFGGDNPRIKINSLRTDTEQSEQRGFVNLAKGLFGTFRNPTAHAPKILWQMTGEDALDLFTLASYVLRRIDNRVK
jgi:uncharacterized protein (TIGR02391 family)